MTDEPVKPEDVLPDQDDFKTVRGVRVRKGTIFAAIRNMETLTSGSETEKASAWCLRIV